MKREDKQSKVKLHQEKKSYSWKCFVKYFLKTWKASTTIESAIVLPICFFVLILIIQVGIMMFDKYNFSMTAQNWIRKQIIAGETDWQQGLQVEINRHLIYPAKIKVAQKEDRLELKMEYKALLVVEPFVSWLFTTTVFLPKNHKAKLYHFLNAKQLISRIPFLDNLQEKYFELLQKIKKD